MFGIQGCTKLFKHEASILKGQQVNYPLHALLQDNIQGARYSDSYSLLFKTISFYICNLNLHHLV